MKNKIKKFWRSIVWGISNIYELFSYNIPHFFINLWFFRKEIWQFRSWDWIYTAQFMKRGFEKILVTIDNGIEDSKTREKKVVAIKRLIELLNNHINDNFVDQSEVILNKKTSEGLFDFTDIDLEIYELANKLEKEQWIELWKIVQGQDYDEFKSTATADDGDERWEQYTEWFDGTGVRGWWE